MNDMIYLYVAYTVIWLGAFLYLAYIHMKQAALRKQMDALAGRGRRDGARK